VYIATKSNSVRPLAQTFDYLLQHGTHIVIANATCRVAHYVKTCHHPQNQKYTIGDFVFPLKPSFKLKF